MTELSLRLLKGDDINRLFKHEEGELLKVVKSAYQAHANGHSSMPPNSYLRFPGKEKERIIAKAAWLGGGFNASGIKWVASFPDNISRGYARASATIIMNNPLTGRPTSILEGSIINAKRTAASAALAAQYMYEGDELFSVGFVGCGIINFETLRALLSVYPMIRSIRLIDTVVNRAVHFKNKIIDLNPDLVIHIESDVQTMIKKCPVVAFGTSTVTPFITSVEKHIPGSVFLHTSLRDLSAEVILSADNVVDDIEQVCSNNTSVHLAEKQRQNRNFIRATIGDIFNEKASPIDPEKSLHIFNPFGLGILDIAVADWLIKKARILNVGTDIDNFLPPSWDDPEAS